MVLAGGASRRMGRDKAVLAVRGETLAARAASHLNAVCARVVVADGGRGLVAGLESVRDGAGRGPAAGILGAAGACPGLPLLVLACDLPAVPPSLLAELAAAPDLAAASTAEGAESPVDWVVPRWERGIEPLCALYRPGAVAALAAAVEQGIVAPHRLVEAPGLAIGYLEGERLHRLGPPADVFLNVNTPEDLARWQEIQDRAAADRQLSTARGGASPEQVPHGQI